MKITPIEVERQLETVVPEENETQRILRKALGLLGPNGENWTKGRMGDRHTHCTLGAIVRAHLDLNTPEERYLRACRAADDACYERGAAGTVNHNDAAGTTFSDVRAVFLRAIELAATP